MLGDIGNAGAANRGFHQSTAEGGDRCRTGEQHLCRRRSGTAEQKQLLYSEAMFLE